MASSVTLSVVRLDIVGAAGAVWLALVTVSSAVPMPLTRPVSVVPSTPPKSAVMVLLPIAKPFAHISSFSVSVAV